MYADIADQVTHPRWASGWRAWLGGRAGPSRAGSSWRWASTTTASTASPRGLARARAHGHLPVGALTPDGVLWAAILADGPEAALTHRSAGHEHAVLRGPPARLVDVTAPTRRRSRGGMRVHCARLDPRDVIDRRGLRFTRVARTLLDLAADLREPELQAAVDEARVQRKLHRPSIQATIARAPGHHGIGALRRAIARHDRGRGIPIGQFERRAIGFMRDHDFPEYVRNYTVKVHGEPFTLDIAWIDQPRRAGARQSHVPRQRPEFVTDRRRSRRLGAVGWQIVRATWVDLDERPAELAADLWALLLVRAQ